ncbi:phage/plasmid primase, P4 family [Peribacillus sp. Aquil_B8]
MAQSNNRRTWSTFQSIVHRYNQGGYDGIGFMFSKDDPFIGIDIDHCVNEGALTELAEDVIETVQSYTEYSPSGQGVHIIAKGKLPLKGPGTGRKNPGMGLEVYRHGRYFTFTGDSLGEIPIVERSDELKILFDKYLKEKEMPAPKVRTEQREREDFSTLSNADLWERMFNSKSGGSIKNLFQGLLINGDHSSTDMALCNHLAFWADKDVAKMDSMFRESNLLREKWDKPHSSDGRTYGQMTIDAAVISTQNTVSDFEPTYSKKNDSKTNRTKRKQSFNRTDLGNAERLVHHHGENIRYNNTFKKWYLWNGNQWNEDETNQIRQLAKQTVRKIYQEASEEEDGDIRAAISKHAMHSEARAKIESMIALAESEVPILPDDLDKNKWLFNCANGVIDLKTGKLLKHDREYYMNKISPVAYDPNAKCPLWDSFLQDIMRDQNGNVNYELIEFLQKAIGYALTGETTEQVVFFLHGKGKNGKSTFLDTIRHLVGDYGKQSNTDSFTMKKNDSVRSDIATLKGSRLVAASESEEGAKLAESLIKQLTGMEPIQARFLYGNPFEFVPQFKIFFTTNHKPDINGDDLGIWRRIRLIPFTVTIPEEKRDKNLPEKFLKQEISGILRWAVEGCLKWQKDGLKPPEEIEKATDLYRSEMDTIGSFISDFCTIHESAKTYSKQLYFRYEDWFHETGEREIPKVTFYKKIEERGFRKKKDNKGFYFQGIGIRSSFEHYSSSLERKKI